MLGHPGMSLHHGDPSRDMGFNAEEHEAAVRLCACNRLLAQGLFGSQ